MFRLALDLTVSSHRLRRHRLSFPRGGEITVRQDLLLAMLPAPAALAQLGEKSQLLEADEVVALL